MPIRKFTAKLKVGHRIAGGFAFVLFIAMAIALTGITGLSSTGNDLRDYAGEADIAMRLGSITADIAEQRRAQLRFMTTGETAALDTAQQNRTRLGEELSEMQGLVNGDEREAVDRMIGVMAEYNKIMDRTVVLRTRRDALIRDTLEPNGAQVRKHLAAIVQAISARNTADAAAAAAITETASTTPARRPCLRPAN
jgi:CHASE3 domain sensor protein